MRFIQFAALLGVFALSPLAFAHHSDAGIDEHSEITLQGKVTNFSWRQPHVFFSVETVENGKPVVWNVQMAAVNVMAKQGWSADSLEPGDELIVVVNPAMNGKPYGKLSSVVRTDGTPVAIDPGAPETSLAVAASLNGIWTGNRPGTAVAPPPKPEPAPEQASNGAPACNSGFDCFFRENLVLTEAGKAAAAAYNPLSSDNPEATCVGRPTPSALMSAKGYLIEIDLSKMQENIFIRSEWFNEERTVWMDGRTHPDISETLATGHSIGHWEGDTLVVDTRNFANHRSPYQIGVPSGAQKHVVERYRLNDDHTSMTVEFMLEDPEFLAQPLVHKNVLYYAPTETMVRMDCNPENTSLFLK